MKPSPNFVPTTPLLRQVVALVGRPATDPDLIAFVTKTLGQKVPDATSDVNKPKWVTAKKHGLELLFGHDILNEKYPLVPKTKKSFVPYLALASFKDKFPEPLPFGVAPGMESDELTKRLGVEPEKHPYGLCWTRALDYARAIVLRVDAKDCRILVDEARELSARCGVPSKPVTGLFIAWAAQRGLINENQAGAHAALLAEVRAGTRRGSEMLEAAWPRGLWDIHLMDKPGLRDFAYRWFHNIEVGFIRDDLVAVFGGREGPYGHEEPVLDDDDANAVQKATRKLDERFAEWVK